jgi:multidrug transporter EmrE-like cation transporter
MMSRVGFVLLLVSAATTTVANLLLRAGLDRAGGFSLGGPITTLLSFMRLLAEPYFAAGFVLYFLAGLMVWFRVIGHEPLSTAYPIMVGLVFVMVSAGAVPLFPEPMSVRKMIGLVMILVGIVIASTSGSAQIQ